MSNFTGYLYETYSNLNQSK